MAPSDPRPERSHVGTELSHYHIDAPLGAGGMGVVFRATDVRLNRVVALKVIGASASDPETRKRFLKEARSASAITHPNIVTIHEVDSVGDVDFIVMELLQGQSLAATIGDGPMAVDKVLSIAEQIASALVAAHQAGIVHRDIKPANAIVSESGHVKLLDFGIAKQLTAPAGSEEATATMIDRTRPGAVVGSVFYMSPEQAQGHVVDGRSDVFSLGVLIYELLAGKRPFSGVTTVETVAKILEATPPALDSIRPDVPAAVVRLVGDCLEKDRARRPAVADVHRRLQTIRLDRNVRLSSPWRVIGAAAAVILAIAGAGAAWWWQSGREVREARRRLPTVLEWADRGDSRFYAAASKLIRLLPDDPQLRLAWNNQTFSLPVMTSIPPGAEVMGKAYLAGDDEWVSLGTTPIEQVRFPGGTTGRVRISKAGYAPYDGTLTLGVVAARLIPEAEALDGMVFVPGGRVTIEGSVDTVTDFWIDKLEITNRQFKAFVDAGGYARREYWKEAFVDGGTQSWEDAMRRFKDRTGRPGPSTWELGNYPDGQDDYPVGGVSWYEAAAFAVFAGKSLPNAYQWRISGDFVGPSALFGDILLRSNFSGKGPVRVGSLNGVGPYGQLDMAGNVKEWCWNESRGGRMILGGGWNEPPYMYEDRDAQAPFSRGASYGIRLVKNLTPQPESSYAFMRPNARDYASERPIDDAGFASIKRLYEYDPGPLEARLERNEDAADWRRETVTINAAYVNERIIVHVYLPKSAKPPYQPVVYFPGGDATLLRSSRELNLTNVDFLIRSGRALVFPVYQGTYERGFALTGPNSLRDVTIQRVKDIRRVVDYLGTRPDLDGDRIGYFGVSLGAFNGAIGAAVESRFKAIVFMGGGLARSIMPPEIDTINFVARIRMPTLMANGVNDFQFPFEGVQRPQFQLLPLPSDQKRHALFDGGHLPSEMHDVIREILDWYDKFLGPIQAATPNRPN